MTTCLKLLETCRTYSLDSFCPCCSFPRTAQNISHQAFLEATLNQASPQQRQLCSELLQLAGGIDQAFAAAFGGTTNHNQFSQRDFITKVAAAASVITLSNCQQNPLPVSKDSPDQKLEKTEITIGFIPIVCAAPILMAHVLKIYQKYGLNVKLHRMPNWEAVQNSAIVGELDAYHMLSPMPTSISLGLDSTAFPIKLASIENINGQSIVLSLKHQHRVKTAADFKGLKIAIPFQFSMHNLLLRYYLASGNLNPDQDVFLTVIPPVDAISQLGLNQIDGFILPDNFGQWAVNLGIGFIHLLTKDLWAGHPCCCFAAGQSWIEAHPNTFRALSKAIIETAAYINARENRIASAQPLSKHKYLNLPKAVIEAVLTGQFEDGLGNTLDIPDRIGFDPYPWQSFANWISSQFVRWQLMPPEQADYPAIAQQIYQTQLAQDLAKELGHTPPSAVSRLERLKFDTFNPANPTAYLDAQIKQFKL